MQFENFQNITSDHKSCNAQARKYDFFINYIMNKTTQVPCFHSNFHIALYNFFMHLSLAYTKTVNSAEHVR